MKTSEKKIEEEILKDSSNETLDPYAVDFFGVQASSDVVKNGADKSDQKAKIPKKLKNVEIKGLDWHKDLPKITHQEASFSNQFSEIPKKLSETARESVQKTFSRFTQLDDSSITCEVAYVREVELSDSKQVLNQTPQVFLTLQCSPHVDSTVIAIKTEFASALIGLILGGKGENLTTVKPLSAVEQTILEFLAINMLGYLNQNLEDSSFSLLCVENQLDRKFIEYKRGAEVTLEFTFGILKGNVTLLIPGDFIEGFSFSQKPLFMLETANKKLIKYEKISSKLATNVYMGETQVNANEIIFLEKDDVILIENSSRNFQEQITVFIGDSTNYYLKGNLQTKENIEDSDVLSEEIIFEVQEIFSEEDTRSQPGRKKMDTKKKQENKVLSDEQVDEKNDLENKEIKTAEAEAIVEEVETDEIIEESIEEEIDEESLASLENVMINLRVNLGGRRMSLKELQKIRIGQIIDLGCRPNDPVEIVTDSDNRPIASGELVEIEGQIGVRLTKVFV